jgi:hypothetical protein
MLLDVPIFVPKFGVACYFSVPGACYGACRGRAMERAGGVLWSVPGLVSGVACCLSVPIPCPNLAWRAGLLSARRGVLFQLAGGVL